MPIELTQREKCVKTSVSIPRDVQMRATAVARSRKRSLSEYISLLLAADLAEREQPATEAHAA